MDEQVGRLRSKLKSLNIADNTLVFYTSDNGPETLKEVRGKRNSIWKSSRINQWITWKKKKPT